MKKRRGKTLFKTILIMSIIAILVFLGYKLYEMYQNIEISDNYTAEKVNVSTEYEQTVEEAEQKSTNVADMIENVTKSVCGISKLSSAGSSILSMATETELGLGTGIIVSSDGYILSNSHVTGE